MTSPPITPEMKAAVTAMEPAVMISLIWVLLAAMVEKSVAHERERCAAAVERLGDKESICNEIRSPSL